MSPEARPAATPFQPGSGALPPSLEPALLDSDSPILLLVAADTGDAAMRAAIGLAEGRGRLGHRTILADASTREPRLHEALGVDNLEGLADVFLFGASLDRVRAQAEGRTFDFIPVGAYVPDPQAVLENSQWERVAGSLRAEGEKLLLFVPADSPGLGILSSRIGEAVLVGDARGVDRAAMRLDSSCRVLAVVEPAVSAAAAAALAASDEGAGEGAAEGPGPEPELTEPVVFRSDRKSRRTVSPVLLVLLVAALIAAAWFAYQEYFPVASPEPTAEPAPERLSAPERGEAVETPIPISVAVEAHQDLESAQERVAALRQAEPGIRFYLAPVSVRGVLYYRLLAGPVTDREAGERLMERLVEGQHKTASDPWAIRPTEQAYHLGDFDGREEAVARVDSLAGLQVPAYIVPIRYEPGPPRYRVYGGAYESAAEAGVMGEMLREAGLEARLVARTGEPIRGDS